MSRRRTPRVKRITDRRVGGSYLFEEWLDFRNLTRSQVYQMWAMGKGPRRTRIGNRLHITDESDQEFIAANTEA